MRHELAAQKLIGRNVRRLRDLRNLTQEDLAERTGRSVTFIQRIEAGNANPTVKTLASICAATSAGMFELTWSAERKASVVARETLDDLARQADVLRNGIRRVQRSSL